MTMTLGEALTADDDSAFDLEDQLIIEGYDKAKKELDKEPKKFNRAELDAGELNGALKLTILKALNIALDDILARAWGGWEELRQYADPEQTPPDDINVVTVSNHTIKSLHEPSVDVVVNGVPVHRFDFEVSVQLDVQGINLEVQGGEITEIRLGNLKLGGSVKLGDRTLLEKDVAKVTIPGVMRLATPIPIRRPDVGTNPISHP